MSDTPLEQLSAWEQRLERYRKSLGLALAPVVFVSVLCLWRPEALTAPAHRLAAVMATVIVLWLTEALPLAVTALLGATACILLRVADAKTVFASFADPLTFLFLGSFILARAVFLHGLDRRLAFAVLSLRWVAARPSRLLFVYGAVTCGISAWISNTATTAMMFTIGLSLLTFLRQPQGERGPQVTPRFATVLMLMTSFAASIGGLATPIGTPPNLIGLGFLREQTGSTIPFFHWMQLGVPVVACAFAVLYLVLYLAGARGARPLTGVQELLTQQRRALGPWTRGQVSTLAAFLLTIALWVGPGVVALVWGQDSPQFKASNAVLPESVAAMLGGLLLFLLPGEQEGRAMTWREAAQIDWGVILLYGGGFTLGVLSNQTGLAQWLGGALVQWLPVDSPWGMLFMAALIATIVSETTSNTASATIIVPIVIEACRAAGIDPVPPALAATLGSSLGFMLPVSTPCNAIVYGSGLIPLSRMVRYGVLLDLAGIVIVTLLTGLLSGRLL